jgi:hypothetical protein
MTKPKFDIDDFVYVATHAGKIMRVIDVRPGVINRYTLQTLNNHVYENIGEYELKLVK